MSECILQKSGSATSSDDCTATAAQVLAGYTAITNDSDNDLITGAIPNHGSPTQTLNCGSNFNINTGYYSGGTIKVNSLANQTAGTATAKYIYSGKTAWVNGSKITGGLAVSPVSSFSATAYSTSQILCSWKNPSTGPYSGIVICAKAGGYPTSINDNRKYTGVGSNSALNGTSTAIISGLTAGTTYYFRIWVYCTCSAGDIYSGYLQAACAPTAHGRQAYTSSGTFTVPANVRSIDIHCTGGGGGTNTSTASGHGSYVGDGGAGGGYTAYKTGISVLPGTQIACVVANGGIARGTGTLSVGGTSSAAINGVVTVSADGGRPTSAWTTSGSKGGSGGGRGSGESGSVGYVGGSDGNQGGGNGGSGQGFTTKEFGTGTLYSGGGGGGSRNQGQGGIPGGAGGGGTGGFGANPPTNGSAGTGGGGGGGTWKTMNAYASSGGSGNVIIRW